MSVEDSKEKRLAELQEFARMLREYLPDFKAPVGLQVNFSCPNVGLEQDKLTSEITDALDVLEPLGLPLMPKLNVLAEPGVAARISRHRACDGICVSNTIPWGKLPEKIKWEKLFDSRGSPLARYGGGGLSGKPLLPLVAEWVHGARKEGLSKLINAGGGILKPKDVDVLYNAGASSVFVGSIAILRPHRVGKTVKRAHNLWRVP